MNTLDLITALRKHKVVPRLAGDQLKLAGETRQLPPELIEQVKADKEELIALLRNAADPSSFTPIPAIPEEESYPASNAQKRLWVLSQFEGGTVVYNIVNSFYLKGTVIKVHLEEAFRLSIQRHESLRTVFRDVTGEPRQHILGSVPFNIIYEDISKAADVKHHLAVEVEKSAAWQFDLSEGPLLKVKLLRLSEDEHALIFGIHHIISDGWSIGVMVQEVMRLYEACCKNEVCHITPLRIHYKDYAHWLTEKTSGTRGEKAASFWQNEFRQIPDALTIPADYTRPEMRAFDGAVSKFYLNPALYARILKYCKQHHATPFNFFRATLSILLCKLSGQDDLVIGTPVSGRNHFDLENQVGLYVNTLPLRTVIPQDEPFTAYLKKVSDHSLKAFEFQDYPFDMILEQLEIKRDTGRNPLFDVMMVVQNTALGDGTINISQQYGFELSRLDNWLYNAPREEDKKMAAKFDLNFNFDIDPDNKFYLEIEYATSLFKKERITQYYQLYLHIITQLLDAPDKKISEVELAGQQEKDKILQVFNSPVETIQEHSILELINPSYTRYARQTAIISGDDVLTYSKLQRESNRVAACLAPFVKGDTPVFAALLMGRTISTIPSVLGILQAGAAYVPVDINYPPSRINYIIDDANPAVILVDDEGLKLVPDHFKGSVIHINKIGETAESNLSLSPEEDLREAAAYLIYTSGSTGKPKGVEICHRNTIAFLKWALSAFSATPFEILYATTSYCFDLSVFEFFLPLMMGKTIRLLDSALAIPAFIQADNKIMINTVPSVVRNLLDQGISWDNVCALNMAGEPIPKRIRQELNYTAMEVRNLYGPSEDTTYSTVYRFAEDGYTDIPVGKPVGYTQLYIMDRHMHLMPEGIDGEIYLSGQSVAKGYLHQPLLTAERFLDNPFIPGLKMYRTGDLGKWLPDGNVSFIGRADDQVKVRGYRIELGEIQFRLEQHDEVEQAVVIIRQMDNEPYIIAYWTGKDTLTADVLRAYLKQQLPAYMVPDYWVVLDKIPLNSNGKVDKGALPLPDEVGSGHAAFVPCRNEIDEQIAAIWKEVLQKQEIGIKDDFFHLGGHSLKATRVIAKINEIYRVRIDLKTLFIEPTIEHLSNYVETMRWVENTNEIMIEGEEELTF